MEKKELESREIYEFESGESLELRSGEYKYGRRKGDTADDFVAEFFIEHNKENGLQLMFRKLRDRPVPDLDDGEYEIEVNNADIEVSRAEFHELYGWFKRRTEPVKNTYHN